MALAANDRLREIYEVEIYLRKSRDESHGEEDILAKHEKELNSLLATSSIVGTGITPFKINFI